MGYNLVSITTEFFYYMPSYDVIASACNTSTAENQIAQGLGTYLSKEKDKLCAYSGGIKLESVDIANPQDVSLFVRAFCRYCSVDHYRAKQQLQSLVTEYIKA